MDMEQRDYDSRTALHVAAAEGKNTMRIIDGMLLSLSVVVELMCFFLFVSGHAEVVRFLLEACKVNPVPRDR